MKKLLLLSLLALGSVYGDDLEQEFDDIQGSPNALLQLQAKATYSQRYETYAVTKNLYQGVNYHNAFYADGSIVTTTLDGQYSGYQGIWLNGNVVADSTSIQWTKDGFIHSYPTGRVTSYANRQVCELY